VEEEAEAGPEAEDATADEEDEEEEAGCAAGTLAAIVAPLS
jgi:hypothetical protein